jgi:hypothetical protein
LVPTVQPLQLLAHLLETLETFLEPIRGRLAVQEMQEPLETQQLRGLVELVALVVD